MRPAQSTRRTGWTTLALLGAICAITALALTLATGMRHAAVAPTACPDTIACHALKRAATPAAQH